MINFVSFRSGLSVFLHSYLFLIQKKKHNNNTKYAQVCSAAALNRSEDMNVHEGASHHHEVHLNGTQMRT